MRGLAADRSMLSGARCEGGRWDGQPPNFFVYEPVFIIYIASVHLFYLSAHPSGNALPQPTCPWSYTLNSR